MYYYTSDLHFGYERILTLCNRPFATIDEMNEAIIRNFNEILNKDDILMILGDVSCYGVNPAELLSRINGKKVLIAGNHDAEPLHHKSFCKCFVDIREHEIIRDNNTKIFLHHYPMAEWDGYYKGIWHFYGHVHNSDQGAGFLMNYYPTAVNVGVDVNDFRPKTAKELMEGHTASLDTLNGMYAEEFVRRAVYVKADDRAGDKKLNI